LTSAISIVGSVAGVRVLDAFLKRGTDIGKVALRGRAQAQVKRIELTGDAQKDIAKLAQRMYEDQRDGQAIIADLRADVANLETANDALRTSFEKMRGERDVALADNGAFVKQIQELLTQARDLASRLATKEMEYAKLSILHEGAKERIEKQEKLISEMQQWLDDAIAREARLEAENERLRSRT
jgi:chromosome segregation ATPase